MHFLVWYALAMVCYAMHFQWYALPCHCMVCISNCIVPHALALSMTMKMVWYALAMEMVCISLYGMEWKWYVMVCISNTVPFPMHTNAIFISIFIANAYYTIANSYRTIHTILCIVFQLYGMHWQWNGMVCIDIGNGNGMVCIDNNNGIHWQWKWYALVMAWYDMNFQWCAMAMAMVCIGNGNCMHFLSIEWYSLETVWYGNTRISIGNGNGNGMVCYGMVCIGNDNGIPYHFQFIQWYPLPFHCMALTMVWYALTLALVMKMVWYALAMEMVCVGMVCIVLSLPCMVYIGNGMVWYVCILNANANAYHTIPLPFPLSMPMHTITYHTIPLPMHTIQGNGKEMLTIVIAIANAYHTRQ
jgi:hypothetical protein